MPFIYLKSRFMRARAGFVLMLLLAILGWFACLYFGFINQKEIEKEDAYSLPVEVVISNIKGSQTDSLGISGRPLRAFTVNKGPYSDPSQGLDDLIPYFSDIKIKSTLYYGVNLTNTANSGQKFVGVTTLDAAADFDPLDGGAVATFFDGYENDFSDTENLILIVPEKMLDNLRSDYIDENSNLLPIVFKVSLSPEAGGQYYEWETIIAGYYIGGTSEDTVYCSWELVAQITEKLSGIATADSISATVKDNSQLDELRELLTHYFTEVNPSGASEVNPYSFFKENYKYAAIVHDETLRETLSSLNRSISTLKRLLPIVIALELAISAVAAYFYIHIRRRELAVARSLGTPRKGVMTALVTEVVIWCIIASIIAIAASVVTPLCAIKPTTIIAIDIAALTGTTVSGYQVTGRTGILSLKEEN